MSARIRFRSFLFSLIVVSAFVGLAFLERPDEARAQTPSPSARGNRPLASQSEAEVVKGAVQAIEKGRETFRFDTFGDEAFWGDTLNLDATIAGAANGGIGPGLSPKQALALGLKVDVRCAPGRTAGPAARGRREPRRPRDHRGAASAERRGRSEGIFQLGKALLDRYPVRALPFDGERFL